MNNPTRGSRTEMVRENCQIFPDQTTLNRFLAMRPANLLPAPDADEPPPLLIPPAGGEAAPGLPEAVQEVCRRLDRLHDQARQNREARRAANRERLRGLLDAPTDQAAPDFQVPAAQEAREPARVRVRAPRPQGERQGPDWAGLDAEAVLEAALPVSAGARRVFLVLHTVAAVVGQDRGYRVIPSTVAYHLPQSLLAAVVGYTTRHLRRLVAELEQAGLIDAGAHAANVTTENDKTRRMWDGSLWAVKLKPSNAAAYLTPEDWRHEWRNFDMDLKCGRTAKKLMSYLKSYEQRERKEHVLQMWAVNPNSNLSPLSLERTWEAKQAGSVQDVIYALPLLGELSGHQLAEAIGRTASEIAHALGDQGFRVWWCAVLWEAVRNKTLGAVSAQLLRLLNDVREWPDMENPGAVFAARRRAA